MSAVSKEFKVDINILNHLIEAQGADPFRAFQELIQNSFDAGATDLKIYIEWPKFNFSDNGTGFTSESEIDKFFATFGTAHETDFTTRNSFGRFRLGRSQIMGLAQTRWRSNEFQMDVDIRKGGLNFSLTKNLPLEKGCSIEGEFYSDVENPPYYTSHLREILTYYPQSFKIYLNHQLANPPFYKNRILYESENVTVITDNSGHDGYISVFNMGSFVCQVEKSAFGFDGTIITKKNLTLDIARQRISSSDPLWKKIKKEIKHLKADVIALKNKKLSTDERAFVFEELRSGRLDVTVFCSSFKFFVDFQDNKHYTFDELLLERVPFIFLKWDPNNKLADHIIAIKRALILRPLQVDKIQHSIVVKTFIDRLPLGEILVDRVVSLEDVKDSVNLEIKAITDKELESIELVSLKAIRKAVKVNNHFIKKLESDLKYPISHRIIRAGEGAAEAWTDGYGNIFINRKYLSQLNSGLPIAEKIAALLIHEYSHDHEDTNNHSFEFYNRFHNFILNEHGSSIISRLSRSIIVHYYL